MTPAALQLEAAIDTQYAASREQLPHSLGLSVLRCQTVYNILITVSSVIKHCPIRGLSVCLRHFTTYGTAFSRVLKTPAEIHNDNEDILQQLGSIQLLESMHQLRSMRSSLQLLNSCSR